MEVRRLTARKEEIYRQLLGDRVPLVPSGVRHLIDVLGKHQVINTRYLTEAILAVVCVCCCKFENDQALVLHTPFLSFVATVS